MTTLQIVKLSQVVPDENQPRKLFAVDALKNLKGSIKKYGIKNPLLVEEMSNGKYLIVDGERRYRAASELGLKEVPIIIEPKKNEIDRAIEQFHIQEMHESWTQVERAAVVNSLMKELKLTIPEMKSLLGISESTMKRYAAFGRLVNKEEFQRSEVGIEWAYALSNIGKFTRNLMAKNDKVFSKPDESKLEKIVLQKIKDGEIESVKDVTKIKDSFTKDPKSVETFLKGDTSVNEMFVKTKAKGAFHLRNVRNLCIQVINHGAAFMALSDVKVDNDIIKLAKQAQETLKKFIDRYDE